MAAKFGFLWLFLSCLSQTANTFNCPDVKYVELGEDVVIDCRISQLGDVYWYKGTSTEISPIVQLEGGRKQVIHGDGHYDINDDGSLIVKDLEEQYYGFYSVVNFHPDDTFDKGQIKIEVAVKPQTPCPIIAACSACHNCTLMGAEMGNVTCGIDRAHPLVHLNIVVDSEEDGFKVINNVSKTQQDSMTETWNTTVMIEYEWNACDSLILLRCITTNGHPFEISDSYAYIKTDPCTTADKPVEEDSLERNTFIILFITGAVVVAVLLGLAGVIWRLRASHQNRLVNDRDKEKESHPLMKRAQTNDVVKHLVEKLAATYTEFGFSGQFPNQQSIRCAGLLAGISFRLTKLKGFKDIIPSPNLLNFFDKSKRSILIVEEEFSKKIFLPYVYSYMWESNEDIIFVLDLTGLHIKMPIADAIVSRLNLVGCFTTKFIGEILANYPCVIVTTGIDELLRVQGNSGKISDSTSEELTVEKLLNGSNFSSRWQELRCLVVASSNRKWRDVISDYCFSFEVINFFPQNVKDYVWDIFKFYYQSSIEANDGSHLPNTEIEKQIEKQAKYLTKLVFDECDMVKDLELSQSLVILLIHMLISDLQSERIDLSEECICKRLYLTKTIFNCIEFSYSNDQGSEDLKKILGKVAFAERENASKEKLYLPSKYTKTQIIEEVSSSTLSNALRTGFVKCKNDASGDGATDWYMFCNHTIQEYLAALAFQSDESKLKLFLKSSCWSQEERMKNVFQFIYSIISRKLREQLLTLLVEEKEWNMLIDCLFELPASEQENDVKVIFSHDNAGILLSNQIVNITHLDTHYHRLAVSRFFKTLVRNNVFLQELSFESYWSREWFKQLEMPKVKSLVFIQVDLGNADDYNSVLKFAGKHDITEPSLRFEKCQLPKSLESHHEETESTIPQATKTSTPGRP